MKIISWNVNGVRSVMAKVFWNQIKAIDPDIICLQELKIDQATFAHVEMNEDYSVISNCAEKKGYSGVAVFYKKTLHPEIRTTKLNDDRFDSEGRYLELDFGDFVLINIYLPHGGRQKENLDYKLAVYAKLFDKLRNPKNDKIVIIGDFNIAHTELDLARPKNNHNNIMFTREERQQIDKIINLGYIDTFRYFTKTGGHYTWWPWLANCRAKNIGWRIDYAFIGKNVGSKLQNGFILDKIRGSDHCPIGIELD